jgi:hypothetical protein
VIPSLIAFLFASVSSVVQEWSLAEFCWSTWLAGLVYSWACVASAAAQAVWAVRDGAQGLTRWVPPLARFSPTLLFGAITAALVLIALLALKLYSSLFGFYGLFLSVYAEMEPVSLFGRNGFINSDFFTPVTYLLMKYWPMALSTLIAATPGLLREYPWKRIAIPFGSEVLRMHVMVIALPLLSLLSWALFGAAYQRVVIVLLIGIFFLLQRSSHGRLMQARRPVV